MLPALGMVGKRSARWNWIVSRGTEDQAAGSEPSALPTVSLLELQGRSPQPPSADLGHGAGRLVPFASAAATRSRYFCSRSRALISARVSFPPRARFESSQFA
jgi:hypothetical protein